MRVLVIRPKAANLLGYLGVVDCEPLELEYLYTVLKDNHYEAKIYDALLDTKMTLRRMIIEYNPDVITITGYITQKDLMIKYATIAKKINSNIKIVIGGVHAELNYSDFYDKNVDYIVHSSSLNVFIGVIKSIDGINKEPIDQIKGICYKNDNGEWVKNEIVIADINDLPIPDRTYFNETKNRYRYLNFKPCALIKTSYGCPYQCTFCYCRKINNSQYNVRNIEMVVDEIEQIECENIYIVDDDFLVDKQRLNRFVELLEERDIHKNYLIYGRADFIANNKDMMIKLEAVGVRLVMVGLEAIDDTQLEMYNKRVSADINEKCVQVLRECNITCMGLMIVNQDATKEDFLRIGKWIERMDLSYVSVSIFTPLPGTDIYDEYKNKLINPKTQDFDFLHCLLEPKHMSLKSFYYEYNKLFMKIYKIAKKKKAYSFINLDYYKKLFVKYFNTLMKE